MRLLLDFNICLGGFCLYIIQDDINLFWEQPSYFFQRSAIRILCRSFLLKKIVKFLPVHCHLRLHSGFIATRIMNFNLAYFNHIMVYNFSMSIFILVVLIIYAFFLNLNLCIVIGSSCIFPGCPDTSIFTHCLVFIQKIVIEDCYASSFWPALEKQRDFGGVAVMFIASFIIHRLIIKTSCYIITLNQFFEKDKN